MSWPRTGRTRIRWSSGTNFPVTDAQTDRLYLGPLNGRGGHPDAAGWLANPMVQAEPSMIALATAADYSWNPRSYDPQRSWRQAIGGSDALAAFADANRTSPLQPAPAPALSTRSRPSSRRPPPAGWRPRQLRWSGFSATWPRPGRCCHTCPAISTERRSRRKPTRGCAKPRLTALAAPRSYAR
ncbi:beta-N-acetylglucosaminidase domain-containing protein [Fodinicola acaciae]|uniref:beta-N-acetylglucosaminidase domain-containing protein n=1 Tax=Fodinicola acaciae TaxID=2681555 RepID=UPI003CCD627C